MFNFDNTYAQQLEGFYTPCKSAEVPKPELIRFNTELASELGLERIDSSNMANIFSGNESLAGASPLAQVYAGHQFGHYSAQLGDGRALLLGEVVDTTGRRYDIQLKGSGRTPYSRGGDGKSALGPVLREYIMSEAMHVLGIPTTRALAAVSSGEMVMRTEPLPGAVFTRVAASHIRIGTFQYFAALGEQDKVRQLADYTIARHYPNIKSSSTPYLDLLTAISAAQASLVAQWMLVGFIHGVMNTDNMTVTGETIDYGPCAFMDHYAPETVFSSIDTHGRYAYQNQPTIAQWNLARLAETLLPQLDGNNDKAIELATEVLNKFPQHYHHHWLSGMRSKLGLKSSEPDDMTLMNELLAAIDKQNVDYTLLFRRLIDLLKGDEQAVISLFGDAALFKQWLPKWKSRLQRDELELNDSVELMLQVNPIYIPRNHKVEEALEFAVQHKDYSMFERLLEVLSHPYDESSEYQEYAMPAPQEFGPYKTFCGT